MSSKEELQKVRLEKLALVKEAGMNPFTATSTRTHEIALVKEDFLVLESEKTQITIAGRIMSIRGQGAILFITLFDGSGKFQGVFKKDEIDEKQFELFENAIDIGDFIECSGYCFLTNKGEQSILVQSWRILTKTLLPLPDKFNGISDDDERYRKRYLDILMDPEMRAMFERKAKFWKSMRNFLEDAGFMEVQTPTLEVTTGGADARPFETHHNDYDMPVFMRISVGELWQKRLMAAGFPKTYEIGRAYRNEGSSPNHLQEFTNMEFYWAYADYRMGMEFVRDMHRYIAQEVYGKMKFTARGTEFDLANNWKEIDYVQEIIDQTGVDIMTINESDLLLKLIELKVVHDADSRERMVDSLWKYCRKNIAGPAFVINYPDFMQPLAKRNEKRPAFVEQFQANVRIDN